MTAEHAAESLDKLLRKHPWYISIGVGQTERGECLFIYVKSARHRELSSIRDGWMGYPVSIHPVGTVRAIKRSRSEEELRASIPRPIVGARMRFAD